MKKALGFLTVVGGASAPERLAEVPSLMPLADIAPDGHSLLLQVAYGSGWEIDRAVLDFVSVIDGVVRLPLATQELS